MFFVALPLFILERAHQWQSLTSADWSLRLGGRPVRRRAVLATALIIGWGEGLGFYVQSQRAFWAMTFWVLAAHVVVTGASWFRGSTPAFRRVGTLVFAIVTLAGMIAFGSATGDAAPSWLGHHALPLPEAFAAAIPASAVALVGFVVAVHALPCLVRNLRRLPAGARLRSATIALACATLEWWLVAKSIWFPETSFFPDLVDWWDLGHGAHFLLHPVWMAPFFAHVVIDTIRFFGDGETAS